ncbi:MAG TPA: NADH-quinone oxidoreductase subunit G, partial [Allosphingosinicella sp.]
IASRHPHLAEEGLARFEAAKPMVAGRWVSGEIAYPISDFYLTNAIARASETMQRCSAELVHGQSVAEAAE